MSGKFGRLAPVIMFVCALMFASATVGIAQDLDNVTISGKVADSNNAPIVGASVTATLVTTNVERTVTADGEGRYRIVGLKPGLYKIRASSSGFGTKENTNLETIAGQNVQLDFSLAPGDVLVEQTVEIGGDDAPVVDTTRTVVGGTVTEREIEELPNNTRDPYDLVFTLGGVTEEPLSTRDLSGDRGTRGSFAQGSTPEEAGTFALSGGAAYSNNITIDGLDNNDDRSAGFRFQPSIESISEVQVITNQFSAEYGRASGGRVNLRTRAGSNRFRGRAFFFFRDDNLNANTWNNNRRGIARAPFRNYDPGVTFSGPIVKDKLFFFTAYEYDKIQEDTIIDVFVPVTNGSRFNLPAPTNPERRICERLPLASGISPCVGSTTTIPPVPITAIFLAPYIQPVDTPSKKHIFSTRVDWNLSDKNNFTFGYQLGRSNDLRQFSGTNRLADALIGRVRNSDGFNATHNFVASAKTVNQFRFQYSTLRPTATPTGGAQAPVLIVGGFTPPDEPFSASQIFGASTSGSSDRKEKRFQFQETLTHVAGNHSLRFGGDYQNVRTEFIDRFDVTGTFRFSSFTFFNQNSVTSFQQNFNTESELKNNYLGVFFQDEWRVRPNITFSYGLRYERESVIKDNNNFGPRASVAWNPFPGNKTVIRVGGGIFYNRVLLRTVDDFTAGANELRFDSRNFPTATVAFIRPFLNSQFPNPLTLDTQIPISATATRSVRDLARRGGFRDLDPNLKIPESYQFNVGFEREIFKGIAFEANFTLNKTIRLWREYNANAPVLPAGTPDRNGDGKITFTDYLMGITTGISRFIPGSPTDDVGLIGLTGGACTSSTQICTVSLNSSQNRSDCDTAVDPINAPTNSPICRALAAIQNLRPPEFLAQGILGQYERVASIGNSNYKGLTLELRSRNRKFGYGFGGSMRFAYTLSSLKDDGIVNTSSAQVAGDFSSEYSRSLLDRRHRVAFSGTFDTPNWMGKLRLSPLFRFGSSAPFNISVGGNDRNLDDVGNDRPNFSGDLSDIKFQRFGSAFPTELASRFTQPTIGSPGNLPRNAGIGPRYYIFDLNLSRPVKFGERFVVRPSIEFGNILNMTVFGFGSNFINFDGLNSSNAITQRNAKNIFLAPTRTYRPRQIRLGMRFEF
ncbi:MAG: TonB-dependent receptor [Pyrinomonadaceae bacterium]|nr:TonB-dependent receptor [Pyrinomonadaceae bacterium]